MVFGAVLHTIRKQRELATVMVFGAFSVSANRKPKS
jgi:hypothetical protein